MAHRNNKILVPEAKEGLHKVKVETSKEVGVDLNKEYNGDITTKEAGKIGGPLGGQMVKKMIEDFEKKL
ncbi:alpha/beta-type small acid-soluble spore protein [Clostridium sp. 'White wine YQ']|uniref:alpha/beta-type small acid-soluble spore protein n=1 Tax=Clostridium sp. 'White wine YQ' TaxID=3027474 RepID=UPI00236686AF|nr:alpha/beta-type small acid-soluble spore protein [Clostridium sp. 'White wine YQ']MDD7794165.1 alpha/beta-type small acid-soluble spore protein [Clostridium sp. 'White wine YQ']